MCNIIFNRFYKRTTKKSSIDLDDLDMTQEM